MFEAVSMTAHESKTHFARSMRTAARYEEVLRESDPLHISRALKGNKMGCANVGSTLASGREFLQWWS